MINNAIYDMDNKHYSRNCTTFQSNNSNPHPYTKTPPRKPQEPRRVAKIKEVLEVQQGEEVSDEEELVTKLYVQDFKKELSPDAENS